MGIGAKEFLRLNPYGQVEYLEKGEFTRLGCKEKIAFLKAILKEELAIETIAYALSLLKQLNYQDRYFFRNFLYHRDNTVALIAKKAIMELEEEKKQGFTILDMLNEGRSDDLILLAKFFLEQDGKCYEDTLLSFLQVNDVKLREVIVRNVSSEHEVDDALLSDAIIKGAAWYVRAALVEILGNRKSKQLFEIIDFLMNDKNVEVKLKLIDALIKLGTDEGQAYLQRLARDPIIWVRKQASQALQRH